MGAILDHAHAGVADVCTNYEEDGFCVGDTVGDQLDVIEGAGVDVDVWMRGEFGGKFFELGFGAAVNLHLVVG